MSNGRTPAARPPLSRPERGRLAAGVCVGLAEHLRVPVRTVRIGAVIATFIFGVGPLLYAWLWVTVPTGEPGAGIPAAAARLAPPLERPGAQERGRGGDGRRARRIPVTDIAIGVLLVLAAAVLIAYRLGARVNLTSVLPALIVLGGVALAWSQLDEASRLRWREHAGGRTPVSVVRIVGGFVLMLVGVLLLVAQRDPLDVVLRAIVASLAVLVGAAIILAPWWLTIVRELTAEREARAREEERADIAAHLHDSVLQTLALIRARAHDPEAVARLSRAQERELRTWLYEDRTASAESIGSSLAEVAAEIEDAYSVTIDVVQVGDWRPGPGADALLMATREALLNAVRHGKPPVSVYCEVRPDAVEVFVRDRGPGFDMAQIPPDRLGVRESIIGRMDRHGGCASVRSSGGRGTEVRLTLPIAPAADGGAPTGRQGQATPAAGPPGQHAPPSAGTTSWTGTPTAGQPHPPSSGRRTG